MKKYKNQYQIQLIILLIVIIVGAINGILYYWALPKQINKTIFNTNKQTQLIANANNKLLQPQGQQQTLNNVEIKLSLTSTPFLAIKFYKHNNDKLVDYLYKINNRESNKQGAKYSQQFIENKQYLFEYITLKYKQTGVFFNYAYGYMLNYKITDNKDALPTKLSIHPPLDYKLIKDTNVKIQCYNTFANYGKGLKGVDLNADKGLNVDSRYLQNTVKNHKDILIEFVGDTMIMPIYNDCDDINATTFRFINFYYGSNILQPESILPVYYEVMNDNSIYEQISNNGDIKDLTLTKTLDQFQLTFHSNIKDYLLNVPINIRTYSFEQQVFAKNNSTYFFDNLKQLFNQHKKGKIKFEITIGSKKINNKIQGQGEITTNSTFTPDPAPIPQPPKLPKPKPKPKPKPAPNPDNPEKQPPIEVPKKNNFTIVSIIAASSLLILISGIAIVTVTYKKKHIIPKNKSKQ